MPEFHHDAVINVSPLTQKRLRVKLSLVLLLCVLLPFAVALAIIPLETTIYLIIISLLSSTLGIFIIWKFLEPLAKLYEQIQILIKGGIWDRNLLQTDDEIESISDLFNQISQKVINSSTKIVSEKDLISAERNKLNAIIFSMMDGIIVLDIHRNVILVNKAAEKLTGYKKGEMVDKKIEELLSLKDSNEKDINLVNACQVKNSDEESRSIPLIANLIGKSKQKARVKFTVSQISEGIQSDLGCILILHDITQEEMFESMQIDFVSMASHEFRTPLTSITNYLSVLKDEAGKKLTKEHREFLDRAFDSSKQLTELVENLLNVSKIERGSLSLLPQSLDWQRTLKQIVEDDTAQAVKKGITLTANLESKPLPPLMADNVRITEVLNNLISNAINYTKEGGKIEVGAKEEGDSILTYVKDNGSGIPKESIPHLFTKFFRTPGALKEMRGGSGLGLYISKSIIDLHKGKIWAESEVGKGSTFYFTLPKTDSSKKSPTILQS